MEKIIEVFRGTAPRCRHCNKPLRPNYKSENMPIGHRSGKFRRAYITDYDLLRLWGLTSEDGTLRDPPTEDEEEDNYFNTSKRGGYNAKSKRYYLVEEIKQVRSRSFLGTFGTRGDDLFCKTECGYLFAVRHLRGK